MTDYSAMSDLEINKAVAAFNPETYYVSDEGEPVYLEPDPAPAYTGSDYNEVVFDPCNNPADAWPLILQHKINIDHRESIKAGAMAKLSGNNEIYAVHANPLRAAMEVYLMAEDVGLLKD